MIPRPSLSVRDRALAWAASLAGTAVLRLIGATSRVRCHHAPGAQELLGSGRPMIYALWHRYQILMAYVHRGQGVRPLISRSRDGELIARTVERLGYVPIRGSSSRGGGTALLEVLSTLEAGGRVSFTPDGPRGPARSVQPGVVVAAQKTGLPVLPLAWAGRGAAALDTWDRFLVPRPFGEYHVYYGTPFHLPPDDASAEHTVRAALDAAETEAARLAGVGPPP
jgi:lysophospholipid acyltransferase (LPLAT)-like uncharacterized protein